MGVLAAMSHGLAMLHISWTDPFFQVEKGWVEAKGWVEDKGWVETPTTQGVKLVATKVGQLCCL